MKNTKQHCRKINCAITRLVIDLHLKGYTDDFSSVTSQCFLCLQSCEQFNWSELIITLIDLEFDHLSHAYKYIHTVETHSGGKGLLIASSICSLNCSTAN